MLILNQLKKMQKKSSHKKLYGLYFCTHELKSKTQFFYHFLVDYFFRMSFLGNFSRVFKISIKFYFYPH